MNSMADNSEEFCSKTAHDLVAPSTAIAQALENPKDKQVSLKGNAHLLERLL